MTVRMPVISVSYDSKIITRTQIGHKDLQKHSFPCPTCGVVITFIMAPPRLPSVLDLEEPTAHGPAERTTDVCALIRTMSDANPLWGAPRIHGDPRKLGITVSQSTVAKYSRPTRAQSRPRS